MGASHNNMGGVLGPKTTKARGKSENQGMLSTQPSNEGDPLNQIAVLTQPRRAHSKVEKYENSNNGPPSKSSSRQNAIRGTNATH